MAYAALFAWPFIALAIFMWRGPVHGLIWSVLIGHLTLPEALNIDLPGLPPYSKGVAVALGCILGTLALRNKERVAFTRDPLPSNIMTILIAVILLSPFLTTITNRERLFYGPTVLPSMGGGETIAMLFQSGVLVTLFLIARRYLFTESAHRALLRALVLAGVVYTFPILFELRFSPQLHTWTYGYFQHSWVQHIRGGGFRPIVFLEHGLWIGFLLFMTVIAACALLRRDEKEPMKLEYILMAGWLMLVLLVSRNLGAAILALLFAPAMLFLPRRVLIWTGMVVTIAFLSFPALRQADLFPTKGIASLASKMSADRAGSLEYRFDNEDAYLDRAKLKPLAGWGLWARWRIWDERTGREVSTADGTWIVYLGERGWLGYIALFGLLGMPIFFLRRAQKKRGKQTSMATVGMVTIIAGNLIYLIPNNALSPISLLVAGGLSGFVQKRPSEDLDDDADPDSTILAGRDRTIKYTRFADQDPTSSAAGPDQDRPSIRQERSARYEPEPALTFQRHQLRDGYDRDMPRDRTKSRRDQ